MSYMLGFLYSGYVCVAENYKSGQIIGKWGLFYATSKRVFPWPVHESLSDGHPTCYCLISIHSYLPPPGNLKDFKYYFDVV